ncbi:hypothetical protein Golomagni_02821 [Golovinomyces magnicellulatus]|nr:hypothetical protein Golomagni_02821 [Golovinomyces magnicellulatus]
MTCLEAQQHNTSGKLIALEGDSEVISTHLRLLPPSQKILIFPPLQSCISKACEQRQFNPKEYIKSVHAHLIKRLNDARSFLQSTISPQHPRIVFMNGGTLRARAICIENICQNLTLGDIGAAESLFDDLVKDGMAGLLQQEATYQEEGMISENTKVEPNQDTRKNINSFTNDRGILENTTETEGLKQLDKIYLEEDDKMSWTIDGELFSDQLHETKPSNISESFDLYKKLSAKILDDIKDPIITRPDIEQSTFDIHDQMSDFKKKTNSLNCEQLLTPKLDKSSKHDILSLRRSMEFMPKSSPSFTANNYLTGVYVEDESDTSNELEFFNDDRSLPSTPLKLKERKYNAVVSSGDGKSLVNPGTSSIYDSSLRRKSSFLLPSLNDKNMQNRSQSLEIGSLRSFSSKPESPPNTFLKSPQKSKTESLVSSSLQLDSGIETFDHGLSKPLFGLTEDFIIHFTDGSTDLILDSVLQSYQDSRYPSFRPSNWSINLSSGVDQSKIPSSPVSELSKTSETSAKTSRIYPPSRSSFDTLTINGNTPRSKKISPPTPSMTPPAIGHSLNKNCKKIITFSATNSNGIISVHNCFRRLLSNYLPPGENGFSQYYWPISSEADRIWKPVFGNWNISECLLKKQTVDRIIAFGCESNVKEDFRSQISGMVERVGSKKNGENRSGRLDIGYLILKALQNINDPTIIQQTFDPFSEPLILANLIIPQLESYFASNSSTQLLVLQFSSIHIPIIYALRDLLGNNLLKIAGIYSPPMSVSTMFPPSPVSPNTASTRTTVIHSMKFGHTCTHTISSNNSSKPSSISTISKIEADGDFSGFDYKLSSSASDDEIIRFVSGIRQSLIEISNFYVPEPEPEPRTIVQVVEKYIPAPPSSYSMSNRPPSQHRSSAMENLTSQDGMYRPNSRRQSNKSKRHSSSAGLHNPLTEIVAKRNYATSIASSRRTRLSNMSGDLDGWENFEIGDDENDFDDYDRMILGSKMAGLVFGRQVFGAGYDDSKVVQHRVASKRKALKWLGLA